MLFNQAELNLITLKHLTMKKLLFSAAVVMGAIGICVANYGNANSNLPLNNHNYIVKDTVPTDTTKPKDSTVLFR